jgi:hypothetical protein
MIASVVGHVAPDKGVQAGVGQRVVYFSDLTNRILEDSRGLERIVVVRHPALENGPVALDVSDDEAESIRSSALRVVSLKLSQGNGSSSDTVTMEIEAFNRLAGGREIADVLRRAEPVSLPGKHAKPISASTPVQPAVASAKEGCGIWPWLAGIGLALVVLAYSHGLACCRRLEDHRPPTVHFPPRKHPSSRLKRCVRFRDHQRAAIRVRSS